MSGVQHNDRFVLYDLGNVPEHVEFRFQKKWFRRINTNLMEETQTPSKYVCQFVVIDTKNYYNQVAVPVEYLLKAVKLDK